MEVVEHSLHLILGGGGSDELHGVDSVHNVAVLFAGKLHLDLGHGELGAGGFLGVKNDTDGAIVE